MSDVKLAPWVSWEETHYNFSYVGRIPALIWRSNRSFRTSVELTRWLPVLCALLFFILFGFASEARKSYQTAFWAVLKVFGVRPEKPSCERPCVRLVSNFRLQPSHISCHRTWNKSSKASVVSTKTSVWPLPVYTVEDWTTPESRGKDDQSP
jgi:hypothetical protein